MVVANCLTLLCMSNLEWSNQIAVWNNGLLWSLSSSKSSFINPYSSLAPCTTTLPVCLSSRAAYSSIFQGLVTTASSRTNHCTKEDEREREDPFHVPPPSVTQTHANIPWCMHTWKLILIQSTLKKTHLMPRKVGIKWHRQQLSPERLFKRWKNAVLSCFSILII